MVIEPCAAISCYKTVQHYVCNGTLGKGLGGGTGGQVEGPRLANGLGTPVVNLHWDSSYIQAHELTVSRQSRISGLNAWSARSLRNTFRPENYRAVKALRTVTLSRMGITTLLACQREPQLISIETHVLKWVHAGTLITTSCAHIWPQWLSHRA